MNSHKSDHETHLESDESKNDNNFASPGHHLVTLDDPFGYGHAEFLEQIGSFDYNPFHFENYDQNTEDLRMINSVLDSSGNDKNKSAESVRININTQYNDLPCSSKLLKEDTLARSSVVQNNSPFKRSLCNSTFAYARLVNETEVSDDEIEEHTSPIHNPSPKENITNENGMSKEENKSPNEESKKFITEKDVSNKENEMPDKETQMLDKENERPDKESQMSDDETETEMSDKENEAPIKKKDKVRNPLVPKSSTNISTYKYTSLNKRIKTYTESMTQLYLQCETFLIGGGFVIKHPSQKSIFTYKFLPNSDIVTILNASKVNKTEIKKEKLTKVIKMIEGKPAQIRKFDERVPSLYRRASIGSAYLKTEWVVYFIILDDYGGTEVQYFEFGDQAQLDNIVLAVAKEVKVEKMKVKKYELEEENETIEENLEDTDDEDSIDRNINFLGNGLFETPNAYETPLLSPSKETSDVDIGQGRGGGRGSRGRGVSSGILRSTRSRGISRGGRGSQGLKPRGGGKGSRGGGRGSRGGGRGSRGGGRGSRGGGRGRLGGGRGNRGGGRGSSIVGEFPGIGDASCGVVEGDQGVEEGLTDALRGVVEGNHGVEEGRGDGVGQEIQESLRYLSSTMENIPMVQRTLFIDEF